MKTALNEFIEKHEGLVCKFAIESLKKYGLRDKITLDDVKQELRLNLINCYYNFDDSFGFAESSYIYTSFQNQMHRYFNSIRRQTLASYTDTDGNFKESVKSDIYIENNKEKRDDTINDIDYKKIVKTLLDIFKNKRTKYNIRDIEQKKLVRLFKTIENEGMFESDNEIFIKKLKYIMKNEGVYDLFNK